MVIQKSRLFEVTCIMVIQKYTGSMYYSHSEIKTIWGHMHYGHSEIYHISYTLFSFALLTFYIADSDSTIGGGAIREAHALTYQPHP